MAFVKEYSPIIYTRNPTPSLRNLPHSLARASSHESQQSLVASLSWETDCCLLTMRGRLNNLMIVVISAPRTTYNSSLVLSKLTHYVQTWYQNDTRRPYPTREVLATLQSCEG